MRAPAPGSPSREKTRAWPWLSVTALVVAAACTLPEFAPEDRPCPCALGYVCNEATDRCEIAGATTTTGTGGAAQTTQASTTTTSQATAAGTADGSSSASGGGGGEPGATPLVVTDAGALFSYEVAGRFRLEGDVASRYQLARWIDFEADPTGVQSAMSRVLYEALWVERDPDDWIGLADPDEVGVTAITVRDESPVRGTAVATLDFANMLSVTTTQTVYASGRIALTFSAQPPALQAVTIPRGEVHHLSLDESPPSWTFVPHDAQTVWFRRTSSAKPSIALLVSRTVEQQPPGHDFGSNVFFDLPQTTLALGQDLTRFAELQIGVAGASDDELVARAADLAAPGIVIRSDVTAVGNGYDETTGVYLATATGPIVEVGATPALRRFAPAFEIRDWAPATWVIRRGGVVEASSDDPIGPRVLARFDAASGTLLFQCLDEIAAGAPESERIFRIEAQ